jgi:protein-S-isoprenylcysteine O-methyltransferase Ste14
MPLDVSFIPPLVVALCVTTYWVAVVVKSIAIRKHIRKLPNVIPNERLGQLLRLIWLPTVLALIILSWRAVWQPSVLSVMTVAAAVVALSATVLTFYCWRVMGKDWRIGIDPAETTTLITQGPFRFSRHPIYSLSIVIALSAMLVVATIPIAIVVAVKIALLWQEAHREEQDMLRKHGEPYRDYQQQVGRFVPRKPWRLITQN